MRMGRYAWRDAHGAMRMLRGASRYTRSSPHLTHPTMCRQVILGPDESLEDRMMEFQVGRGEV